ncbi:MAG: HEAT repeat domain-containing protein [Methanosarcinales archaeon]|nr:HEAT repeat domain-containing protein [Methanosarcinales archaeon]
MPRFNGKPAVAPLTGAMICDDWYVREIAANILEKIGWIPTDPVARSYYLIGRKGRDELVEVGPSAVSPLVQSLADGDWHIRKSVAQVLGEIRDASAIDPLIRAKGPEMP